MKIEPNNKVDILLAALEERYTSLHKIRDRVQTIGIWALGLLLGAGGWVLQSEVTFTCQQRILAIFGVMAAFVVLRFFYFADQQKGFNSQQSAAARIENALGLFATDVFDESGESIYPKNWQNAGSQGGDGKFFDSTYGLLYVGVAFLVLTILFSGSSNRHSHFQHHEHLQWSVSLD